ncbi:MAG TPA: alpha-glucan family phosphorylase, partial [Actinomycetota bacterium]|nr:alpha-glucan family phosphorylase [Actinomycetota bacterium]
LAVAIDEFDRDLMEKYFASFAGECGVSFDELLSLGRPSEPERRPRSPTFNMAVMGIRLAAHVNGVSALHGEVSRDLFKTVWPERAVEDVPITHVTNGVHVATWLGRDVRRLGENAQPSGWVEDPNALWTWAADVPDEELWNARSEGRSRLVGSVRARLRSQLERRGRNSSDLAWTDEALDPDVLTLGFARRFAQYKRATLMLADEDRLRRLLLDQDRPVQIVIAGKSHPLDDGGKEMIRSLLGFSLNEDVRGRIVLLEDYDMELGRLLTHGADVWLNNPRRPLEACGTSGMKAVLNGVLNCSVLDGWWDECYNERVGWAIGGREVSDDLDAQDKLDAESLYGLLETEVVPLFYDRTPSGIPAGWVEKMRANLVELAGRISAHRMLNDYVEKLYEPAARESRKTHARMGGEQS